MTAQTPPGHLEAKNEKKKHLRQYTAWKTCVKGIDMHPLTSIERSARDARVLRRKREDSFLFPYISFHTPSVALSCLSSVTFIHRAV